MNFKIFDGRGSFYQWDLNQKLIIEGASLNDKIHFKNIDGVNALVVEPYSSGENILVDVPNVLLQKANSITVWVYVNNDHTKEQAVFNVIPRQKPADYIYTPTEVSVWKVLEEAVENIPNEYAKKNHVHSQYLTAETDPSVEDWAKKGSEYEITGNPVTLENIEHMPMNVITTLAPIQAGSGDPSPSNIRTISGWTGAKLTRCGKNLANLTYRNGIPSINNGLDAAVYGWASDYVYIGSNNVALSITEVVEGETFFLFLYDENKAFIGYNAAESKSSTTVWSATIPGHENARYCRLRLSADANTASRLQLELGSIVTAYTPYQGDAYTADFGQTVYGGTLDWQTGVLTVDARLMTFNGSEDWAYHTNGFFYMGFSVYARSDKDELISSHYPQQNFETGVNGVAIVSTGAYYNQLRFYGTGYTDVNVWKSYLSAQNTAGTPIQVCYRLATPQTIQLTAHEIEALQGTNTLYGDGSLNVSGSKDVYWLSKNLVERIKTLESAIISLGGNV